MGVAAPLIYLDSCIVIYLVEQHPTYFETVRNGIRTPDALHLATASHYGCVEFWTNDDRLAKVAPTLAINVCARPAK